MKPSSPSLMGMLAIATLLLAACGGITGQPVDSNGARIYFTATNDQGERLTYSGGPPFAGMGMMNTGLACVSCHGRDGRGGKHVMHMWSMDAPDIRWSALAAGDEHGGANEHGDAHAGYELDDFRLAIMEGKHPDGEWLDSDMPRWNLGDQDLADLAAFLKSLP